MACGPPGTSTAEVRAHDCQTGMPCLGTGKGSCASGQQHCPKSTPKQKGGALHKGTGVQMNAQRVSYSCSGGISDGY